MDLLAKKSSQSTTKNVIISSEEFSWINNKNCLTKLKGSLKKYFDKIYIVVYIRRQDSQVISFCQEEAKSGGMVESSFFNCGNKSIPKYQKIFDEYLDYNKRLSLWADVFKDENLFIRIFEKNHLYKNDVVLDFFKILGVKNNIKLDRHNESWGFEKTKVAYLLEKNKINKYFKKHILKGLDNTGKLLPSINEAKKFYNNYIESNIKLNMRFDLNNKNKSIFSNDFTNYPKENADSWDENSANSAITNIIQSINNINQKDLLYILIKSKLFNFKKKIYNFRKKFM